MSCLHYEAYYLGAKTQEFGLYSNCYHHLAYLLFGLQEQISVQHYTNKCIRGIAFQLINLSFKMWSLWASEVVAQNLTLGSTIFEEVHNSLLIFKKLYKITINGL